VLSFIQMSVLLYLYRMVKNHEASSMENLGR
jgi:hypothetical protein